MTENKFPEHIKVRDAGVYDDLGGLGGRIYTTAGQGYKTQTYIREDLCTFRAENDALNRKIANILQTFDAMKNESDNAELFAGIAALRGEEKP